MSPIIIIKVVSVVALGCAAAVFEAVSSQKMKLDGYVWIALGIVVLFYHKNGKTVPDAPGSLPEKQDSAPGLSVPGLPAPRPTGGATGWKPAGRQAGSLAC